MGNVTAFQVKIGNKQYFDLYDRVGEDRIIDELASYAENEVVKNSYCLSGKARTKTKGIFGPHTGEYVQIIVECL